MNRFLDKLMGRDRRSANQAKERLKLVLNYDRADLSTRKMETLRDELIDVISQHVDIDAPGVSLEMTQDGRQQRLIADIPLLGGRRRR